MHDDLFERLEHDHAPLSAVLLELGEWFKGPEFDRAALTDKLYALTELVIEHFGEEEETVFPLLAELAPEAAASLASLAEGHDAKGDAKQQPRVAKRRDRGDCAGAHGFHAIAFNCSCANNTA